MKSIKKNNDFSAIVMDGIFAPKIVAFPYSPWGAGRELCWTKDGELRNYCAYPVGDTVHKTYMVSKDWGITWETRLRNKKDPGSLVKCPWADYWLGFTVDQFPNIVCIKSVNGPGSNDSRAIVLPQKNYEPIQFIPLRSRHRWVVPASNLNFGGEYRASVFFSDDDGETWTEVPIPQTPNVARAFACDLRPHWYCPGCEPSVVELSDGTLLMALRTSGEYASFSRSTDNGETWSVPEPCPGFWQANTRPNLMRLRDGRIIFFWNNTVPLPNRSVDENPELHEEERNGVWESQFTNRDILHAAISEDDGKTWIGFREIAVSSIRNDADYRELGNIQGITHDKSVHQSQALELPNGKVILTLGQNPSAQKIIIFDPAWLYETSRTEDFRHGLGNISHFLYVKSLMCGYRGWAGHSAANRIPGGVMARDPDTYWNTVRESLLLCRIDDPRLISTHSGFVWNFPALKKGTLEIDCRIEGDGFQIALQDHWTNPCDEYLAPRSFAVVAITPDCVGGRSRWTTIHLEWDCLQGKLIVSCANNTQKVEMNMHNASPAGISYLHVQSLAPVEDLKGTYFHELRAKSL